MSAKQEEMFALMEQKDSSQSVSDFCQAHNIRAASFYYWQKKYRELTSEEQEGFAPVELGAVPLGNPVATVQLPGGALITLYHPETLSYIPSFL